VPIRLEGEQTFGGAAPSNRAVLTHLAQDVRYGMRTLLKTPTFTAIAVMTLALGIGANSAIFSFVDGALLKPLPYTDPERIVLVWEKVPGGGNNVISALNFLDWQKQSTVFETMAANTGTTMTLSSGGEPVQLRGARGSAGYFEVFKIKPTLGRTFAPDEDQPGHDHVVVLSHRLWVTQFGADPAIVGAPVTLNGEPFTVIGVMPAASVFDRGWSQFWRPLAFRPSERTRDFHWLQVMARLKPGVTLQRARGEMDSIGARIANDYPDSNKGWGVNVERFQDVVVGTQLQRSLYVLLAAVGMLLLIACANLANLTLARGTAREREVAVRAALGAGRGRLIRQFLTENIVLATIGGVLGLALGYAMIIGLKALVPPFTLPRDVDVSMDVRVLLFALALSMATGIVCGLAPAFHATKPDLTGAMKEGGRGSAGDGGRRRLRSTLVVVEVALAFMLLVGGGLLVRSFFHMMSVELGFNPTNVLTFRLPIASDRFADPSHLTSYVRDIVAHVRAVAGVGGAAASDALPLEGFGNGMPFQIAGREFLDRAIRPACGFKMVQPEYFSVLGVRLLRGRSLSDRDTKGSPPVAVINEAMVKRYFPDQDPIGQRLLIQEIVAGSPQLGPEIPWEIVGVIADERTATLEGTQRPGVYVSLEQSPTTFINVVVRSRIEPQSLQRAIAQAVHDVNNSQALTDVRTLEQMKSESAASNRLRTILLGSFAWLALLLSAVGIYGTISYTVLQRTHEIGVRAALGASERRLLTLVLVNGMKLTLLGLLLGLAGSLALTRLLSTLLVGIGARDPATIGAAAGILVSVAFLASYVPARRAAKLDPLTALRCE
jgi:putative ABC transport system permease protein